MEKDKGPAAYIIYLYVNFDGPDAVEVTTPWAGSIDLEAKVVSGARLTCQTS